MVRRSGRCAGGRNGAVAHDRLLVCSRWSEQGRERVRGSDRRRGRHRGGGALGDRSPASSASWARSSSTARSRRRLRIVVEQQQRRQRGGEVVDLGGRSGEQLGVGGQTRSPARLRTPSHRAGGRPAPRSRCSPSRPRGLMSLKSPRASAASRQQRPARLGSSAASSAVPRTSSNWAGLASGWRASPSDSGVSRADVHRVTTAVGVTRPAALPRPGQSWVRSQARSTWPSPPSQGWNRRPSSTARASTGRSAVTSRWAYSTARSSRAVSAVGTLLEPAEAEVGGRADALEQLVALEQQPGVAGRDAQRTLVRRDRRLRIVLMVVRADGRCCARPPGRTGRARPTVASGRAPRPGRPCA